MTVLIHVASCCQILIVGDSTLVKFLYTVFNLDKRLAKQEVKGMLLNDHHHKSQCNLEDFWKKTFVKGLCKAFQILVAVLKSSSSHSSTSWDSYELQNILLCI